MNLLKRAGDVIHVGPAPEEHALLQPNALLAANEIAVWTMRLAIIQLALRAREIRAKRFVSKHRLPMQRETITRRARNSFRLKRLQNGRARDAELFGVNP